MYILQLSSTPSTNTYLKALCKSTQPRNPICVITDTQTQGRGQFENTWEGNPKENIYTSIFFPIKENNIQFAQNPFQIAMLSSLAIVNTLKKMGFQEVCIKWPNDIYYHNKKIAGILIENIWQNKSVAISDKTSCTLTGCIIGVGLNVLQEKFKTTKASSLKMLQKEILEKQFITPLTTQSIRVIHKTLLVELEKLWNAGLSYTILQKQYEQYLYLGRFRKHKTP